MLPFIRDEKHRKGRSGCLQILDMKTCQAQKAENINSRINYAVKYATARGHLNIERNIIRPEFYRWGQNYYILYSEKKIKSCKETGLRYSN